MHWIKVAADWKTPGKKELKDRERDKLEDVSGGCSMFNFLKINIPLTNAFLDAVWVQLGWNK